MTGKAVPFRPRKSLGQNFLRDRNIARKIAGAVDPRPEDIIVEIGPGEGALSGLFAGKVSRLIGVEIDERAVFHLRTEYSAGEMEVIHGDFLSFDLDAAVRTHRKPLRLVGNIPYNITSPLLFHILDHRHCIQDATLMLQKEVVDRLVAGPGSREYGIPSVLFRCFTDVRKLFDVSPNVFRPKPSVVSSVIRIVPLAQPRSPLRDEVFFRSMVRAVFGKRRKTLRNSLRYFLGEDVALPDTPLLERRPEDLSLAEFIRLSDLLRAAGKEGAA